MFLPRSRENVAPIPETINRATTQQPALNKVFDFKNGLTENDLRQGDILLMLGNYPSSCVTCACALSPGSSHVGVVLELDGKLWLVEAVAFAEEDVQQWLFNNVGEMPTGVIASNIQNNIKYYTAIDVYRPIPALSPNEIVELKRIFYNLKGKSYEKSSLQLLNIGLGCPIIPTNNSLFCSELVARMFDSIGRVNNKPFCWVIPNWRACSYNYRPVDIPNIIDTKRIGHMANTRQIWDIRGWTFGIC